MDQPGVFQDSALQSVRLPSTLRRIERNAFFKCAGLRGVVLPEGLETIGSNCFSFSGLERLVLPPGVREVGPGACYECERLRSVALNEGLERLGPAETVMGIESAGLCFAESAVRSVRLPSTLRRLEVGTFKGCRCLRRVEVPEGVECLGERCFAGSRVEEVSLPGTLRAVGEGAFGDCGRLRVVWVGAGCALDVRGCVGDSVEVRRK